MSARPAPRYRLEILADSLAVCRRAPGARIPGWSTAGGFTAVTRSDRETTLVCAAAAVPARVRAERGWRALRVRGPLSFDLVGVLAALLGPLAHAGVPVFVLSTFDTDVILVRDRDLAGAVRALRRAGHRIASPRTGATSDRRAP